MGYDIRLQKPEELDLDASKLQIWLNPLWMEAVATVHNIDYTWLVCWEHDNLMALMPIYIKRKLMQNKAYNPVLAYYSPIMYSLPETGFPNRDLLRRHEINIAIARFLKKTFTSVSLNLHPEVLDMRGFTWNGLSAGPLYTFVHQTDREPLLFAEERNKHRVAQRQGYRLEQRFDPELFCDMLYDLYDLKNHDFGIKRDSLITFLNTVSEHGLIRQYNLVSDSGTVSSDIILCDQTDTCYALLRGTTEQARKLGASVMQNLESARAVASEYKVLDFLGANIAGPARFKAAFGYELKLFFRIQC